MLAKKVLYCFSYTSSPFAVVIFEELFAQAGLKAQFS
jgi:hypothetical protein